LLFRFFLAWIEAEDVPAAVPAGYRAVRRILRRRAQLVVGDVDPAQARIRLDPDLVAFLGRVVPPCESMDSIAVAVLAVTIGQAATVAIPDILEILEVVRVRPRLVVHTRERMTGRCDEGHRASDYRSVKNTPHVLSP